MPSATFDRSNPGHKMIVGLNLCLMDEEGIAHMKRQDPATFTFVGIGTRFAGISGVDRNAITRKRRETLLRIMQHGDPLVPWQPWSKRHPDVKAYVLELFKDLAKEEDMPDVMQKLKSMKGRYEVRLPYERGWQQKLHGVMDFLENSLTVPLRSCAVPIPTGVSVVVHRNARPGKAPKMGFRATTVIGDKNYITQTKDAQTSRLVLQAGTLVVPAVLLYTDPGIEVKELEMLVIDGHYGPGGNDEIVPSDSTQARAPLFLRFSGPTRTLPGISRA